MKKSKTIIVIDGGGRGAALVAAYGKSSKVKKIIAIPGNDLMQLNTKKKVVTYQHLKTTSVPEILEICKKEQPILVDVAQDNAVEKGLVNEIQKLGILVFGPTREAGQIEWDKAWSREFMWKYKIPHPTFKVFNSQKEGIAFIQKQKNSSWFIKASGLAEGKGALPAKDNEEAIKRIKQMKSFGASGETFLIEQWVTGEEFSSFAFTDGNRIVFIGNAQDHKRQFNGDEGENTGGMGCSTPALIVTPKIQKEINAIIKQTVEGLKKEGKPYTGVLYLGGILVNGKVYIIEFNARWGDPEAEILIPSILGDFYKLSKSIAERKLSQSAVKISKKAYVTIALSSKGYPVDYSAVKGKQIFGIDVAKKLKGITIYGAGVKQKEKKYYANGGRLLYIVSEGKTVLEARKKAYEAASLIYIEGNNLHYRTDIGFRDVERYYKTMLK